MFSKDDYKEYFSQISGLESFMVANVNAIISRLDNRDCKDILRKVADDETKHYNFVRQALDLILE